MYAHLPYLICSYILNHFQTTDLSVRMSLVDTTLVFRIFEIYLYFQVLKHSKPPSE